LTRLLPLLLLAGCQVSLTGTTDAAPCSPSTRYFASDLWLRYIDANQCATPACHSSTMGHGYLRFDPPGNAPVATTPLSSWPPAWQNNYVQAVQLVRCDQPQKSRLLTVPEGKADPHPPGDSVSEHALADQMFLDWISAP
jgi:hypothetical protein